MTSLATLPGAWCAYAVRVPSHDTTGEKLFYVGLCPLADVTRLPDARNNSEWIKHIKPTDTIVVTILAIMDDQREAAGVQAGMMAVQPWCNVHGVPVETLPRVRCIETGVTYDSIAHAAECFNVTRQAMSAHVNRKPGAKSIKGATFERCQ
jgi:hypothetical protein